MNDFMRTLKGEKTEIPPMWMMRQAGRYLPEYRDLRASVTDFMAAALTPEVATEITLQPMRRYPQIDAAILFSDILMIPYALGQDVKFVKGEGPQLGPLGDLSFDLSKLDPVIQTVKNVKAALPTDKTLIGFAGSPWTVACYMISGRNHDEFLDAKKMAFNEPEKLDTLLDTIADATIEYLLAQIDAGADVVQLFESWCGLLTGHLDQFERFIMDPTSKIVAAIREVHPDFPVIGFPRQAGVWVPYYAMETGVTAVGLDWSADLEWIDQNLPENYPVQGNLDPTLLMIGGEALQEKALTIIDTLSNRPFIFNLGHGVIQFTPPEHVAELIQTVKQSA